MRSGIGSPVAGSKTSPELASTASSTSRMASPRTTEKFALFESRGDLLLQDRDPGIALLEGELGRRQAEPRCGGLARSEVEGERKDANRRAIQLGRVGMQNARFFMAARLTSLR